jgi:hypothetical protein
MDPEDPFIPFEFEAKVIYWRGPSPFFFAVVPTDESSRVRRMARIVSYGWGVIPVEARIGETVFTTSLFPKPEGYLLPLKDAVRRATAVTAGDRITVTMALRSPRR